MVQWIREFATKPGELGPIQRWNERTDCMPLDVTYLPGTFGMLPLPITYTIIR